MRGKPRQSKMVGGDGVRNLSGGPAQHRWVCGAHSIAIPQKTNLRKGCLYTYNGSIIVHFGEKVAQRDVFAGGIARGRDGRLSSRVYGVRVGRVLVGVYGHVDVRVDGLVGGNGGLSGV